MDPDETTLHLFLRLLSEHTDLPRPLLEIRFSPQRKWRFDCCWHVARLAVELDGGQWLRYGGRHGADPDRQKINDATCRGWAVLRYSRQMLEADPAGCARQVAQTYTQRQAAKGSANGN